MNEVTNYWRKGTGFSPNFVSVMKKYPGAGTVMTCYTHKYSYNYKVIIYVVIITINVEVLCMFALNCPSFVKAGIFLRGRQLSVMDIVL
jgi:hypothetical protein